MDFEYYFKKYQELFTLQRFNEHDLDYSHLETHIAFLKQLAVVENSSVAVMDVYKKQYVFLQSKFLSLLGKELQDVMNTGPRAFYEIMHPADISFVIETLYRGMEFILDQAPAERKDYKIIYEFRLKARSGTYERFMQQLLPLELDTQGNIWLMLMVNDLLPARREEETRQRAVLHTKSGTMHVFTEKYKKRTILSKREVEILSLIAAGKASKQVADELFLSVNTVNNHRRNILEKTQSENTAEAIRYALRLGLM